MIEYHLRQISCFLLLVFVAAGAGAQDTAMFRENAAHSAVYEGASVSKFTQVKWKFSTGGKVMSSPAVVNGTVYIGSDDHYLYAINAEGGALKWKFKTRSRVSSSPAVWGGLVYFASFDGNFYAVDAATGQQRWKFQTAGERRFAGQHLHGFQPAGETMPDPFDFYLSSPVVRNGMVFFGSGDTNVYALDAASGELRWKFKTGEVVHASPAIADGTLFIGSWDSFLYALDATTGKEKWRFKTGEDHEIYNQVGIQSSVLVADGIVYFGCRDSNFYAVDAATGQKKWAFSNKGSWVITSPVAKDGKVYFATSDSGLFHAVDAKTGASVFSLNFSSWPMFSSPAIVGNMLYIGSHKGTLIAIDLAGQKVAWEYETDASRQNGPALTNAQGGPNYQAAFANDDFYDVMVIGLDKMLSVGAILSSPVVVDGTIYFGSSDGNVYALR